MKEKENYIILPNIRSSYNVGSIFRTADALGISKIFLVGYTPCPLDRFKRPNKEIAKTALGAENTVLWEHDNDIFALLEKLKNEGVKIFAIEQDEKSVDYKTTSVSEKNAFIFGSEVDGIDSAVLALCDQIIEIPMHGKKESLNVAVSVGVALFRVFGV